MNAVFTYADTVGVAAELVGLGKAAKAQTYCLAFSPEEAERLSLCGADAVVLLEGATRPIENNARAIADILAERGADLFLVGASAQGRDLAARTAAFMDRPMASDVASLEIAEGFATVTRALFGGAVVELSELPYPAVATVPAGLGDATAGETALESVAIRPDDRVSLIEETPLEKTGMDLHGAKAIIAVGMGVREKGDLDMVENLASILNAGISCTRGIAEERHWLPIEQYVGLSGETVAPDLYLTLGVSGQVQHVAGIRGSKIIAAVNTDANAPIFKTADYGIIGDLYDVVPALVRALENR